MAKKHKSTKKVRSSSSLWRTYTKQRDEFYAKHPQIRMLLGLLIVSFTIAVALMYYNKTIVYIGLSLDEYGIRYPYVDMSSSVRR